MSHHFLGLDLGQAHDPTAIGIIERVDPPAPELQGVEVWGAPSKPKHLREKPVYHLRHLERLKLNTSYPDVVRYVLALMATPQLARQTELVVDATGVGRPVVDLFVSAGLKPTAITIVSGSAVTRDGRNWRVPKRDLVVNLQVLLQAERLKVAEGLPEGPAFVRELEAFKVKVDAVTAHDSYNAREGAHDDLVLAVAMAAYAARSQRADPFFLNVPHR